MRVINKKLVNQFSEEHADARGPLSAWVAELEDSNWETPIDLKSRYPSASFLGDKQVVFNIKGNSYRALAVVDYQSGIAIVKRIGTHSEYDKWEL
jgi:mRNA interferase HigB